MIYVVNPQFKIPDKAIVVNTTSRSHDLGHGLSPFLIGPCSLYDGHISKNMENAWQFSKVYEYYLEDDGTVGERYIKWAQEGWSDTRAHRYPMGRGAKPLYSYWDGHTYGYVDARKKIYIPLYQEAVQKRKAWQELKNLYEFARPIYLIDFDAHNLTPGTFDYWELWNNPNIKVGHAYVLAMMLEGTL
jgi:hypothetical protein